MRNKLIDTARDHLSSNGEARFFVNSYLERILDNYDDGVDESDKVRLVHAFASVVTEAPVNYSPEVHIDGLKIKNKEFNLGRSYSLRPVSEDDLALEFRSEGKALNSSGFGQFAPMGVVEFEVQTEDISNVFNKRDSVLSTLQLYDLVSLCEVTINPNPLLRGHLSRRPAYGIRRRDVPQLPYQMQLDENSDGERLARFFEEIQPIVHHRVSKSSTDTFVSIAFNRYQNALVDDDSEESRLTSAIMSLEALFLGNEGELSDKLSRRTGILLGHEGENEIEVYDKIKQAYRVRSNYVHASKDQSGRENNQPDNINKLTDRVLDYTRRCIIIALQLSNEMVEEKSVTMRSAKKRILNDIQNASLNDDARESFHETFDDAVEFRTESRGQ